MSYRLACTLSTVATTLALTGGAALAADPTTADCLAASDASLKLGNQHKLRAERSQLLVCAAQTCPADIRKECLRRVDQVNMQIPTIVFSAKDVAGADLSDVKVTMDGEVLVERLEGTALSIDPGEHTFVFETAGQPPVSEKLIIIEGQKDRREKVTIGATTASSSPPLALAPASAPAPPRRWSTMRTTGVVLGGAGVAAIGAGAVFGLMASSAWTSAQDECGSSSSCPNHAQAVSDHDKTVTDSTISTIGLIAGGVLAAGGVALFVLGRPPSSEESPRTSLVLAPAAGPGMTGFAMKGTF